MHELKWKKKYDQYLENQREFEDLWIKSYALIWYKYCSREVQCELKEMSYYNSVVKNEPL